MVMGRRTMRRGLSSLMCFSMLTFMPVTSSCFCCALMPMTVAMQEASAVATRSVGEKDSPLPQLSTGASVMRVFFEGPWVAWQRRSLV